MARRTTLLELVTTLGQWIESEADLIATIAELVNTGTVELCGNFRGCRIVLEP